MNMHFAVKSARLFVCLLAVNCSLSATESKPDEPDKAATPAANSMRGTSPGEVRDDNGLKMKLVWCPPGVVAMEDVELVTELAADKADKTDKTDKTNDDDVDPQDEPAPRPRKTTKTTPVKAFVTKGYWLGKYEVSQSEWKQLMKTEPWKGQASTKEGADFPATFVDWTDATSFCRKLTEQERQAGRLPNDWEYTLPTEAQWERACRARTETVFSFGDDASKLRDYAWFYQNAADAREQYAHRVGQKKANPWGLFDMHGNVWEWCRDTFIAKLPGGIDPVVKPDEKAEVLYRVLRGGGWSSAALDCSSAHRYGYLPSRRHFYLGCRVALSSVLPGE